MLFASLIETSNSPLTTDTFLKHLFAMSAQADPSKHPLKKTHLIYYRLMLPNWLRKHATWNCSFAGDDLNLNILPDSSDWENILRVPLIPKNHLQDDADITVKMKVGAILPVRTQKRDPLSYMITDRRFCVGIQLVDPATYGTTGPYRAVEGEYSARRLRDPNTEVGGTVTSAANINPDQFEFMFKPSEYFGSAYCAIDSGHKVVAQYSDGLRLGDGLFLDLYRYKSVEEYTINYIEVEIYSNTPSLD